MSWDTLPIDQSEDSMAMDEKLDIWLFRRDLRLDGHTGIDRCFLENRKLLPLFIFDPRQVEENAYRGPFSLQFLVSALGELDKALKKKSSRLHVLFGKQEEVLAKLISDGGYEQVHTSRDFTPFAKKRDEVCRKVCKKNEVEYLIHDTLLLNSPEKVSKDDGTPYTVFTPFHRKAAQVAWAPIQNSPKAFWTTNKNLPSLERVIEEQALLPEIKALEIPSLEHHLRPTPQDYSSLRDIPSLDGTTGWSAHLKFGTISPQLLRDSLEREDGPQHPILRQLYWRDFFHHIGHHFPHVFGNSFQAWTQKVKWPGKDEYFEAWCEGNTGFPIVDAGMRELVATGKMHNRVRMVVASFLTKDLEVDWRKGEKFFAQHLEDYDPCLNNGNWQWAASTGCDAQPYFRIFNPWLQQKRFDPEGLYIKKWVPELSDADSASLHNGFKKPISPFYSPPIVDHGEASTRSKSRFADARNQ